MEVKNIVFEPRQLFDPCQNFIDPRYLPQNSDTLQNLTDQHQSRQNFTLVTHELTLPTYPHYHVTHAI